MEKEYQETTEKSTLLLTTFSNKYDTEPKKRNVPKEKLTKHVLKSDKDGGQYCPAIFEEGKTRSKEAVEKLTCVVLDYDEEGSDLDTVLNNLAGVELIYHTTHSNTPDHERFRIIILLSEPVTADSWPLVHHGAAELAGRSGLDSTCREPARAYYGPSCPPEYADAAKGGHQPGRRLTPAELIEIATDHHPPVERFSPSDGHPGDDFNSRVTWAEILTPHGWTQMFEKAGTGYWRKPGGSGKEHHATTNHAGSGLLYVFTCRTPLPAERGLTKFTVHTYLNFGGDFQAAAKDLAAQGYGSLRSYQVQVGDDAPEPTPLPDELSQVAQFDFELLPGKLRSWVEDICDRVQCPPDYVAVGLMTGLGAVIGRKLGVRPQARTDWTVTANQWGLIVGRPGVLKSPALEAALAPLKRLAAKAHEEFDVGMTEHRIAAQVAKLRAEAGEKEARKQLAKNPAADVSRLLSSEEPEEPTLRRYIANDTSPASLGELFRQNHNGLLVFRDELVSLLKGLDREDQAEGRGFYLTGWNGDSSYTFDRITRGMNLHIPAVCLSILGSTQPGRLAEYVRHAVRGGAADDGLIQRFGLLVWPDIGGEWKDVDRWPDNDAKRGAYRVFESLDRMNPEDFGAEQDTDHSGEPEGIPYLRFDDEGLELFVEWRHSLERRLREGELHPALESHFAKYRKLIPGLALILHLADGGSGPISGRATLQALAWGEYLETHARRAYGSVSQPETAAAKAILQRIKKGDLPNEFSARDIYRNGWSLLSDRNQVGEGLRLLVDCDWLQETRRDTGGRSATIYQVNPRGSK